MEGRVLESTGAKSPFHSPIPCGSEGGECPFPTPEPNSIQGNVASLGLFGLAATQPLPASDQPSGREEGKILREGRPGIERPRPRVHYMPVRLLVHYKSSLGTRLVGARLSYSAVVQ